MTQNEFILVAASTGVAEERIELTWTELARACDCDASELNALIDEGVLPVDGNDPGTWRFAGASLRRVRVAMRLTRDLDVNLPGAALALDLLDEIDRLRLQLMRVAQM